MGGAREQRVGMPEEGRLKGDVPPAGLSLRGPLTAPPPRTGGYPGDEDGDHHSMALRQIAIYRIKWMLM